MLCIIMLVTTAKLFIIIFLQISHYILFRYVLYVVDYYTPIFSFVKPFCNIFVYT